MRKTGYLFDQQYMLHDTGAYHPEVPERLQAVHKGIEQAGIIDKLILMRGKRAAMRWIELVHDINYIRRFEEVCFSGRTTFDVPDNQMCQETYDIALLAVGGILEATDRVMKGELDNAFCAVRPPGHHAEVNQAMGFCYFNNVAIAARYLQEQWQIERVGIVDFDVHHGNGTQHIFEKDPTVFYYSIHEHPSFAYPGTGRDFEIGSGDGYGFTKNSLALPGQGDDEYRQLMEQDLIPAFDKFKPEVLLVSAGFDAHEADEMADMNLSTEGFSWIMQTLVTLADTHCQGRLISVLEGGYNLKKLPELAGNHVKILLGE